MNKINSMQRISDGLYNNIQGLELQWWTNNHWTPHVSWNQYDRTFFQYYALQRWQVAVDVGSGPVPILCSHNVDYVHGIGIDPLCDEYAKIEKYQKYLTKPFTRMSSTKNLLADTADIVFCMNMLDHVQDPGEMISELHRITKSPTGILVLYVDIDRDPDPAHPFRLTRDWLADSLLSVFEPVLWLEKKSWKWKNQVLCFVGRSL